MAEIAEAIYSRLSGYAGLAALVSTRIYPVVRPQESALPAVTFFQVSEAPLHAMGSDAGLAAVRFQVSSWAETYSGARSVAAQVEAALRDYAGTVGGVTIQRSFFEGEVDLFESDLEIYQIAQDYVIWHE